MNRLFFFIKNRLGSKVLLLTLLLCAGASGSAFAIRYVATNGVDDGRDGTTPANAVRTIQRAHDLASPGEEIVVGPGTYFEQVVITKNGLRFRAQNGPNTVFINGTDLLGGWTRVGTTNVWKTSAMTWNFGPASGNTTQRGYGENQLFQDTTMLQQLRWPKNTSTEVMMPTMAVVDTAGEDTRLGPNNGTTTIFDSAFTGGSEWVGAQIFVNLAHNSFDGQGWVGTVLEASRGRIKCNFYWDNGRGPDYNRRENAWAIGKGTEYYLFNPAQGTINDQNVDARLGNGEWYKNGTTGTGTTLYVKTFNGSQPNSTPALNIRAKRRYFAFAGNGVASNYTVDGFNLFGCSVTTFLDGDINHVSDATTCSGVIFRNLDIKYISHQIQTGDWQLEHAGWSGLVLNGNDHRAENCTITYSATSAISMKGDRSKALNNRIFNTNYMLSTAGAINTGRYNSGTKKSLDLEIGGNLISNTTVAGIYFGNMKNSNLNNRGVARIHHNTIVNYALRSADCGAIEGGFSDLQWARIDHNYVYNTRGHDSGPNAGRIYGIYIDFGNLGDTINRSIIRAIIDHNVVTNSRRPITINDGSDVEIFNNVVIANPGFTAISNGVNQSGNSGRRYHIFNNILSAYQSGGSLANARFTNNISDATQAYIEANPIFVNPRFTGTTRNIEDFRLLDNNTTRTRLIDKGDLNFYNAAGVTNNDPVVGNPDLGAFEWGTLASPVNGTGYAWVEVPSSYLNTNANFRLVSAIRDGNTTTNAPAHQENAYANNWQGVGIVWSSGSGSTTNWNAAQKTGINRLVFYNGTGTGSNGSSGYFAAGLKVQYISSIATDGKPVWTDASGWTSTTPYPYNSSALGQVYTFNAPSGQTLPATSGVRLVGQLLTTGNTTKTVSVREVEVYAGSTRLSAASGGAEGQVQLDNSAITISDKISVFPNPVQDGWITVGLNAADQGRKVDVTLSDLSGKEVYKNNFISNGVSQRLNIGKLTPGVYIIRIKGANTKFNTKVVVE